jgi:hypothetical protein
MQLVNPEKLEALAAMGPSSPREEYRGSPGSNGHKEHFDLPRWVEQHHVPVRREGAWNNGGYRYVLDECPFNGHTDNSAYILQLPNGAIAAGCHHNSCQGYGWSDFREYYEPDAYERNGHQGSKIDAGHGAFSVPNGPPWPVLGEEAYCGLAGRIVREIEPHSEADCVALLTNQLVAVGRAIGRGSFVQVGADRHHLNLNMALVGETSKGRKGTSWNPTRNLMHAADPVWVDERIQGGLSSGEGLISAVRDQVVTGYDENDEPIVYDEGVEDKRLCVIESEFARVLKAGRRDTNTVFAVMRLAWDGDTLQVLTRKDPMKATGAHISIIGHITRAELLRYLTETETANGFANRFLWLLVKRSKELPFGGAWHTVDTASMVKFLRVVLEFGKNAGEITWGDSAKDLWREVYGPLSEGKPGLFGAVVGRAEAQVLRLAALYAVMAESQTIELEHLKAALALWDYAEESARYIFGDATGDPVVDRILDALRAAGKDGLTRTEIRNLFGRHKSRDEIDRALALLSSMGRIRREYEPTGGRPTERWFSK